MNQKLGTKAPRATQEEVPDGMDLKTFQLAVDLKHTEDCLSEIPQRNEEINEVSDELMGLCNCKTDHHTAESCGYCRMGRKLRKIVEGINADIKVSLGD